MFKQYPIRRLGFLVLASVFVLSCAERAPRQTLAGATMGTTWSVVYEHVGGVSASDLQTRIEAELEAINAALSTYIPDSEISRVNDAEGPLATEVSTRFATVLNSALEVGAMTSGAYDITVGPLIELWGFGSRDFDGLVPSPEAVAAAKAVVGADRLQWTAEDRQLQRPANMRIDFSSVAKGYAVDRVSDLLSEQGVQNSLVEIGGELRARGQRPEGGAWQLAVESPEPAERRFIEALTVGDAAVATSGDYRNFFEVDGQRYSHLVDPRTGYPVAHDLVSVTVVRDNCMEADALATALIVMGLEDARDLAETENIAAHFVSRGTDGLEVHYTSAFNSYRRGAGPSGA